MADELTRAADALREATRLVVLTGAGASTESGIPDFRGSAGPAARGASEGADARTRVSSIWSTFDPRDFEFARFQADPKGFWELRARLMDALALENARPNAAHEALARASRSARYRGHVTQNIDGLFQLAGHAEDKLVEIHGSARKTRCIACLAFFPYEPPRTVPPRCAACGGVLKPGTILFGELLHEPDLRRAETWAQQADAVLVVGTSLVVHPVAALPALALARGARLVIVNQSSTPYDEEADVLVRAPAGAVLPAILTSSGFM